MPWQDRLRSAVYIPPSGVRIVFDYENVRKSHDEKGTAFDFPDADGTYVQRTGRTGRRLPLRVIFWGDDHDLLANKFDDALAESGIAVLEHPLYGSINVVPLGIINFRNDLKTAANQTIIELTFWETIGLIYPSSQIDPASAVLTAVDEYDTAAAQSLVLDTDLDSAVETSSFKAKYNNLLADASVGLQNIANTQDDVKQQFDAIKDSINNSIDALVGDPLTLGFQTILLIQSPARALTAISARLEAYNNLANSVTSSIEIPGNDSTNINAFHVNDLYASTYVTGSIISVINNVFITKVEAIEAAETIINQMDALNAWRDDNLVSLSIIDDGTTYQQLQEAVALTVGFLVEISFTLAQERIIILESPHTIIDLINDLYPKDTIVDDVIDFFIQSNDLTGSEILELPKGRRIVYYV